MYHEEGKTLVELGALYERSPGTVWGWFQRLGIPTRTLKEAAAHKECTVTDKERAIMYALYQDGLSSNDVAEEVGRDGRLVRTHLKNMGVLRGRTEAVRLAVDNGKIRSNDVQVDDYLFEELTAGSAWVLGLIYGDGHVRNNAEHYQYMVYLAGTEEVCRKVAKLIGHERGPVPHNQGANCWVLKWSSRRMVKALEATYGISGKKSTRLRLPNLPEELMGHFLRGLWDADGHWRQPKPTHSLHTSLTTASIGMVEDLTELLSSRGISVTTWSGTTVLKGKKFATNTVRLRSWPTKKFSKWLYEDSNDNIECSRKSSMIPRSYRT